MSNPDQPAVPADSPVPLEAQPTPIDKLREKVTAEQGKRKDAELQIQQLEAQIAALGQVSDDIEKIAADYQKEHKTLLSIRKNDEHFNIDETKCLKNILGDTAVTKTNETVAKLRAPIIALDKKVQYDEEALGTLKTNRISKETARNEKKKNFEIAKNTAITIKSDEKDLDAFHKEIKTEHDSGHYATAYWLVTARFASKLKDAQAKHPVIEPEALLANLITARDEYVTAIADFFTSDTAVKTAEKALEAEKAKLDLLKKEFEIEVRKQLAEILPQRQAA
jgi:DNA modification methylase